MNNPDDQTRRSQIPHVDEVDRSNREQLLQMYVDLEADVVDIERKLKDARGREDLGNPSADPEWKERARYAKTQRTRLMGRIKIRLESLRRAELGGDPRAMQHRTFLHGLFVAVKALPAQQAQELFAAAREWEKSAAHRGCTLCGLRPLGDVQGTDGVSEHVDPEAAEPSVMGNLA